MKKYVIPAVLSIVIIIGLTFTLRNEITSPKQQTNPSVKVDKNTVIMLADRYEPANLTIKKGERLRFVNSDSEDHWPASDNHPSHQIYSAFDPRSPVISGSEWEFTFNEVGNWEYHDHLYPSIRGIITVTP